MPKALVNGINIHYQTSGQGPDLVLIHGATGNMAFWYLSTLPTLRKEFRVTVYDMRGHGYSDVPPSGYTSADMADDLRGLLDHLGIERAHLLGHSFGGVVALHTAAFYPERVDNLILADSEIPALQHLCNVREWPYWEAWNARLREFGIDIPDEKWDDLDYVLRQSLYIPMAYGMRKGRERKGKRLLRLLDNTTAVDDFRELAGLTMDRICQIKRPTLAIYGELSPFLPACRYLEENMPNCKSVIVPTGHFHPALEPEAFVEHVRQFLHNPVGFAPREQPEREISVLPGILDKPKPKKVHFKAMRDKKILLVAPEPPHLFPSQYEMMIKPRFVEWESIMTPLNIATIAALTPDDIQVDLWDESVHGRIDESTGLLDYDLVGVTGYVVHLPRAREIAKIFRKRGIPVAIGGVGVTSIPERYREVFDIFFIGEAELTWPQFIADWKSGDYRKEYRQVAKFDLTISPPPRWDSLADNMKYYSTGAVQTIRGCHFDCEFCNVVYLHGHRLRQKTIDQVIEEVVALERLGLEHIFFTDDNFNANPQYTKELLRQLVPLNRSFRQLLRFSTQASITVAKDEEMLELLADANFVSLFIGIETPNKESLKETNKYHNVRTNLIADCKRIMSYGIAIRCGVIVGFDHDTSEIFDEQFKFVQEAGIPFPSPNMLKMMPGTKLWRRLHREGRALGTDVEDTGGRSIVTTKIIPKQMTRMELMSGFLELLEKLADWENFAERVKAFKTFSEYHRESLHELTDRIIAKANSAPSELSSVFAQGDLAAPGAKREVAAEVLKAVEQELRMVQTA